MCVRKIEKRVEEGDFELFEFKLRGNQVCQLKPEEEPRLTSFPGSRSLSEFNVCLHFHCAGHRLPVHLKLQFFKP